MTPEVISPTLMSSVSVASDSSGQEFEKVRLRFSYGGRFMKAEDGVWKYTGGNSYLESIPRSSRYSDLVFRMSEKVQDSVAVKYQIPGEDLDPDSLITVCDDSDLQEMMEEYYQAVHRPGLPGGTFRLRVYLFEAEEELFVPDCVPDLIVNSSGPRVPEHPVKRSSWSSIGSNISTGSQHSTISKASGKSNAVKANSVVSLQNRHGEVQEAAWEDGFRAGQEAQFFDEQTYWQDVILSKLSIAAKNLSFTDFPANQYVEIPVGRDNSRSLTDTMGGVDDNWAPWAHHAAEVARSYQQSLQMELEKIKPPEDLWGVSQHTLDSPIDWGWQGAPENLLPNLSLSDRKLSNPGADPITCRHLEEGCKHNPDAGPFHILATATDLKNNSVLLPKLGSDLGVGSENSPPPILQLPSHLGSDLGNEALEKHQEVQPEKPGHGELPSPSFIRQRSGSSIATNHDRVHMVPANEVKVLCRIGEGAFGEVSLATIRIFGKVAVKWLKAEKLGSHAAFWQEAELLEGLNHPHVIRFFGVVVESTSSQQVVGIITEYMAGGSLSSLLQTPPGLPLQPPVPMRRRAELALCAANGMSYLHELRIVHFDLKPDNLLLDGDLDNASVVKVADFGLSKHKYANYVSGCRDLRGTLPYMAPELVSDPDHVSEKADVWSFGIVMWEFVARQVPYFHLSPQQIVAGLMQGCLRPEIPSWVEDEWRLLIESCLRQNPQDRPSFHELSLQLERLRDQAAFLS